MSGRWSKPHLSTVPLKAFLQLRQLLLEDKISLMLDLKTHGQSWPVVKGGVCWCGFATCSRCGVALHNLVIWCRLSSNRTGCRVLFSFLFPCFFLF